MNQKAIEARREYMRQYRQRPEVKARQAAQQDRYWSKIYERMVKDGKIKEESK